MKFTLRIDPECDEEVIVYTKEKNALTDAIEALINAENRYTPPLIGYIGNDIIEIHPEEVYCFFIEDKKLFASLKRGNALIRKRLYEIEEALGDNFVKINQSSIANMKLIDRFSLSIGATLTVHFKNGRRDYVSRRQTKLVKERLGI